MQSKGGYMRTSPSGAIQLNIFSSDNEIGNCHITVVYLKNNYPQIYADIVNNYKHYFGRNNVYNLNIVQSWGKCSYLVKSWNSQTNVSLNNLRIEMINFINQKYPNSIDTSRYDNKFLDNFYGNGNFYPYHKCIKPLNIIEGYVPQHLVLKNNNSIGKIFNVTFSIQ